MIDYQHSVLLELIKRYPNGIKEYDLLTQLHEMQSQTDKMGSFDHLALFQQHFLLFHALYKLCDQQHADKAGHLVIEALNIQWLPYRFISTNNHELSKDDPLRRYYLDFKNLEDTSSEDVDNLLASFWIKMNDDVAKNDALALFELSEPCDFTTIKKRYHQLLKIHHPDKGGCIVKTQSINDAMAVLKRCYPIINLETEC